MKNIVIFGAPGSGKGTQSELLKKKYGFQHISTGELLRKEIKDKTEIGKTANLFIAKGQLIPDDLIVNLLSNLYDTLMEEREGIIFDGFPRTIVQAESLKKLLQDRGAGNVAVIDLSVPEDDLIRRRINRGKESGRSDDNEEVIRRRLEVYRLQTLPLIDWYKAEKAYHYVDGIGEIDRIFNDICAIIDRL